MEWLESVLNATATVSSMSEPILNKFVHCYELYFFSRRGSLFACSTITGEKPCGFKSDTPPLNELKIPKKLRDEIEFL